ncbi:bifunctional DNA primase/polymerase [Nitrospirillum sp. BR 11163]|uniref:bifunctional DNA primase/polymerase n=1 Tax=Nitrospirillum sp. BR 11163 TaxID=3104323 RepID=UPI002B003CB7|nr:bifunctional DNA primase/polymerase [Nitrospirillum sp. BR 11163]MEA1674083.1 bifunctional DNA primase/polymerase [Nitrospirillum sp. BR 11163]
MTAPLKDKPPGNMMLDAALEYALRGWRVFPCKRGEKVPATPNGCLDATCDPDQIKLWWGANPLLNIGIATGKESGLWVVDLDVKAGEYDGHETLRALCEQHGPLPLTATQTTPSGGRHLLWAWPDFKVKNSAKKKLGAGIDTRGEGGYIVAPPSRHPNGGRYAWDKGSMPDDVWPLPQAPDWLMEPLRDKPPKAPAAPAPAPLPSGLKPYVRAALDQEEAIVRTAPNGARNETLHTAAFKLGTLVGRGELSRGLVESRLTAAALACGLDVKEIARTLKNGLDGGEAKPRDPIPDQEQRGRDQGAHGKPRRGDARAMELAARIWRDGRPPSAGPDAVKAYLAKWGLDPANAPPTLRAGLCDYWARATDNDPPVMVGRYPALIAAVGTGDVRAVHLTFIAADGQRPADIHHPATGEILSPRRLIGVAPKQALRLARADRPTLVVGVPLEVGLTAHAMAPNVPVWTCGSLQAAADLIIPEGVTNVVLALWDMPEAAAGRADLVHRAAFGLAAGIRQVRIAAFPMPIGGVS